MREWNDVLKQLDSIDEVDRKSIEETAQIVSYLIKRRKELNITQADLAKRTGLQQSAIARFETSSVIPRMDTIQKIARGLNMKIVLIPDQEAAAALA